LVFQQADDVARLRQTPVPLHSVRGVVQTFAMQALALLELFWQRASQP
jgi:hypothetical protein